MTKDEHQKILNEMVTSYEKLVEQEEQILVQYALEHDLNLSLGDYGVGRTLVLEKNHWSGHRRGEWLYSSENC